MSQVTKWGGFY